MNAHADLNVWFETSAQVQPAVVVPYVQSPRNTTLQYLLRTLVISQAGQSRVSQGGALSVPADTAVALPTLHIVTAPEKCWIELVLSEQTGHDQRYEFDCVRMLEHKQN